MQTTPPDEWRMQVESGLAAHFKEADGTSRPGTSWLIGLVRGGEAHHVRVKALLADDATKATRRDARYQAATAMQYLAAELTAGWQPGDDREHTILIGNPSGPRAPVGNRRPWWRLW